MTTSRASKSIRRDRQHITRTACEPCREKRAKCDGEKPCGRCQTRKLECHFTQRTWASKQSLQDEAASLREQVHRRDRVLDAICASDASGDEVLRMLREGALSYDEAYEKVRGSDASKMNIDTGIGQGRHNSTGSYDYDTCWSPSTIHSNMLSSASGQSPFSFMENGFMEDATSQPSTASDKLPQQPNALQQQMDPMQSIPWATSALDAPPSFGAMLEGTTMAPPVSTGIAGDCPTVIDPMLWPPVTASDPLGQPMLNSWTGLMGDPTDASKAKKTFACMS